MGVICLFLELHREGSALAVGAAGLFFVCNIMLISKRFFIDYIFSVDNSKKE